MLDIQEAIALLEKSGYQVLNPIPQLRSFNPDEHSEPIAYHAIVDTEAIGTDPNTASLLEFGAIVYAYGLESKSILGLVSEISQFNDPGIPIPPETTLITGITDEDVAGQSLDLLEIEIVFSQVSLVIAHNAAYDRPLIERALGLDLFSKIAWACTYKEIDWLSKGWNSSKLEFLIVKHGFWHKAHRAVSDCYALLGLLMTDTEYYPTLMAGLSSTYVRIFATGAAFSAKDLLKGNDYFWSDGTNGMPKAWFKMVKSADAESEYAWLLANVFGNARSILSEQVFTRDVMYSSRQPAFVAKFIG